MKLYLAKISGTTYDEYDAVLVRAESEEAARAMVTKVDDRESFTDGDGDTYEWVDMAYPGAREDGSNVTITRVHDDGAPGEIISSFNAG
ncbi:hypothetical protein ACFPA8_07855 [Streptomyces ovatisporus]|uniref:Uncharacterized protein n=1 Tax=Streptomyces ovatisporus TaxID=1128682 RepID=A0ABV9A5R1_9ACTN